jgi:hypothetical protein
MKPNKYVADFLDSLQRRRLMRRLWLRWLRFFSHKEKVKLPKKMTEAEKIGVSLFLKLMREADSKLYYDIQTQECFIKSGDGTIYLFLEPSNLKAINTVVGYDIPLQHQSETFLSEKFRSELNRRRTAFKKEALEKVDHSLHKTFDKILYRKNENNNQ